FLLEDPGQDRGGLRLRERRLRELPDAVGGLFPARAARVEPRVGRRHRRRRGRGGREHQEDGNRLARPVHGASPVKAFVLRSLRPASMKTRRPLPPRAARGLALAAAAQAPPATPPAAPPAGTQTAKVKAGPLAVPLEVKEQYL